MSSAHVTGVAALLWTKNPQWSNTQIRARLRQSAVDIFPGGYDNQTGYGRVSASRALADSLQVEIDGPTIVSPGAICSWHALVSGGSGGYSYRWTQNQTMVGSDESYVGAKDPGITNNWFVLRLEVESGNGGVGVKELTVTEDPSSLWCAM